MYIFSKNLKKNPLLLKAAIGASLALVATAGVGLGFPTPVEAEDRCYYQVGDDQRVTSFPPRVASGTRVISTCS